MRASLIVVLATAVSFGGVIAGGFWLRPRISEVSDTWFGLIAALTIVAVPSLTAWILIRTKIATTGSGPGRGHRNGAYGLMGCTTPEQIAYRGDRQATATCAHLRAVERAMRSNPSIEVDLLYPVRGGPVIRATCRIHKSALRRKFALPAAVAYREQYDSDRGDDCIPTAYLVCTVCTGPDRANGIMRVLHPDECYSDTPWFPTPPR